MKDKLLKIQTELKAPKKCFNAFGKYNYRSAEDILESVKPLLANHKCILKLSDELVNIGERYYIKATARLEDTEGGNSSEETCGYAREEETKKGMDGSQITGASSSYARKYALNGLFLIDESKDSDYTNKGEEEPKKKRVRPEACADEETINKKDLEQILKNAESLTELSETWIMLTLDQQKDADISKWFSLRKEQIKDEMKNG